MLDIGTKYNNRFLSCLSCEKTMLIDEYNIKHCKSGILSDRCRKGIVNTFYYDDLYICTECKSPYFLSDGMCKDIYSYYGTYIDTNKNNIYCGGGFAFISDKNQCISCKSEGCKGKCKYEEDAGIICEEEKCIGNYFEIRPNSCELCSNVLIGCENCTYIEDLGEKLYIPKRQRRLICTLCKEEFLLQDGECIPCYITDCEKCKVENNHAKCIMPIVGNYIDENGIIQKCETACNNCSLDNNKKLAVLKLNIMLILIMKENQNFVQMKSIIVLNVTLTIQI